MVGVSARFFGGGCVGVVLFRLVCSMTDTIDAAFPNVLADLGLDRYKTALRSDSKLVGVSPSSGDFEKGDNPLP